MLESLKDLLASPNTIAFIGVCIAGFGTMWAANQRVVVERTLRLNSERNAELNQEALNNITGGDSFCYLRFCFIQEQGYLMVIHNGKYPVYDVEARIVDLDKVAQTQTPAERIDELDGRSIHIGNLTPGFSRNILPWTETIPRQININVYFVARNGGYMQMFRQKRENDEWITAIRIEHNGICVFEEISDSFPRNQKGEIVWD